MDTFVAICVSAIAVCYFVMICLALHDVKTFWRTILLTVLMVVVCSGLVKLLSIAYLWSAHP